MFESMMLGAVLGLIIFWSAYFWEFVIKPRWFAIETSWDDILDPEFVCIFVNKNDSQKPSA